MKNITILFLLVAISQSFNASCSELETTYKQLLVFSLVGRYQEMESLAATLPEASCEKMLIQRYAKMRKGEQQTIDSIKRISDCGLPEAKTIYADLMLRSSLKDKEAKLSAIRIYGEAASQGDSLAALNAGMLLLLDKDVRNVLSAKRLLETGASSPYANMNPLIYLFLGDIYAGIFGSEHKEIETAIRNWEKYSSLSPNGLPPDRLDQLNTMKKIKKGEKGVGATSIR